MDEKEKIIQTTTEDWLAVATNTNLEYQENYTEIVTSLILTNKRLIMKDLEESISLKEIEDINIKIKEGSGIPYIEIKYGENIEIFRFSKTKWGLGHTFRFLSKPILQIDAEWVSYTGYWASLLTMARFLYGSPRYLEE